MKIHICTDDGELLIVEELTDEEARNIGPNFAAEMIRGAQRIIDARENRPESTIAGGSHEARTEEVDPRTSSRAVSH